MPSDAPEQKKSVVPHAAFAQVLLLGLWGPPKRLWVRLGSNLNQARVAPNPRFGAGFKKLVKLNLT